jgi:hypothetical protein
MKALILDGKVVDVCEQSFEVHASMSWHDCDEGVSVGYSFDGTSFSAPVTPELPYNFARAAEYPPVTDYLDGIVKGDQAQIDAYIAACQAVKTKYPKPE